MSEDSASPPHGNVGNRNAAKPEEERLTAAPAITIRGCRNRIIVALIVK